VPGGLFIDKILTNADGRLTMAELQDTYADAPLNLQVANYFSCEAVFCSELQEEGEIIDTSAIYELLTTHLTTPRLAAIIRSAQLITPRGCTWYYGKSWSELATDYGVHLELVARHDLCPFQPYYRRAYQYVWRRSQEVP